MLIAKTSRSAMLALLLVLPASAWAEMDAPACGPDHDCVAIADFENTNSIESTETWSAPDVEVEVEVDESATHDGDAPESFPFHHELVGVTYPNTGHDSDTDEDYDSEAGHDGDDEAESSFISFELDRYMERAPHGSLNAFVGPGRDRSMLHASQDTFGASDFEVELEVAMLNDQVIYSFGIEREMEDFDADTRSPWTSTVLPAWRTLSAGVAFELEPLDWDWTPQLATPLVMLVPTSIEFGVSTKELTMAYVPESESEFELGLGWKFGPADTSFRTSRGQERSGFGDDRDAAASSAGEFEVEFERDTWSFSTGVGWERVEFADGMWLEFEREREAKAELSFEPRSLPPVSFELFLKNQQGGSSDFSFTERSWGMETMLDLTRWIPLFKGDDVSLEFGYEFEVERLHESDNYREDTVSHGVALRFDIKF